MIDNKQKEKWMFSALSEAKKAEKMDEVPIGSIIVKDNAIIGRGFNQMESLKDSTAHAEIIAITSASNTIGDWRLNKCSLYVTKEPCLMCVGAILNSRIENLYYGMPDKENGYITTKKFINNSVHLKSIECSILEFDSKKIIQDFFLNKR